MSQLALRRLLRIGPLQLMLERTLRGDWKSVANRLTLGTLLAKTVPMVPSATCAGTTPGSLAYALQSGIGTALPTQLNCCTAVARPVLDTAFPTRFAFGVLWKTPMPPRTTARGLRTAPSNAAICAAVPYVQEKPMRGLRYSLFGVTSFRAPKICSTSALYVGTALNRLASSRSPYWICRLLVRRYESPSASPAVTAPALWMRLSSERVKNAGRFAARSASEL